VNEAEEPPLSDELRLAGNDAVEKGTDGPGSLRAAGVMAADGVMRKSAEGRAVAPRREILERANAQMARRYARENSARQRRLAPYMLAGGNGGQGACCGHAQSSHGLADQVFAQDGTDTCATIAVARKRRGAGAFELNVVTLTVGSNDFAEQDGAAVAQLRNERAELVAGIGLREWFRAFGHPVACQDLDARGAGECNRIEAETAGEFDVELDELRGSNRRRAEADVVARLKARVSIIEAEVDLRGAGIRKNRSGFWGSHHSLDVVQLVQVALRLLEGRGTHRACSKLYGGNVVRRLSSTGPPTVKW